MKTDYSTVFPEDLQTLMEMIDNIIESFPGWETHTSENSNELYNLSADLATDVGMVAFNYAAGQLGLSAMQASIAAQNIYHKIFGKFQ